ncbi:D-alanyl-D-alanine carboxypeptidase/D-alanyl-D-alanine endopeptidase [Spirillospora sp. CA-294931]|uniref:D-alanyl-D-alanine carboxypeptidase/D-alanyl-D-alanine endopeptidase n=1 Tax=Spirillospora sp. CA-294931 TaxID=3240042 RepID=UPI003D8F1123
MAKLTPENRLSPQPPAVARRDVVRTVAASSEAGDHARVPGAALAGRLTGLLNGPGAPINAVVIDAVTRRPLFERNASRPATPASTTKLVTSVAALAALGPAHRIATRVVKANGNGIVLVGGGDPTLTALPRAGGGHPVFASLGELARQTAAGLKASGVRRVRVDYDVSAYQGATTAPGWKPNYLPDGEVAPLTALTVDEGRVSPGNDEVKSRVADPAKAGTASFLRLLRQYGVAAVPGRRTVAPKSAAALGAVQSPTVAELVEHLMTVSDNDVAEAMIRQVAIKLGKPASFGGGAQAVREVLSRLGAADGVLTYDGSGLSTGNRITPMALARLASLAASPERPELRAAITGMPVAGFTGTLSPPRYTGPSSQGGAGVVRAKTGTLSGVSTLAGVAHDADGRLLAFAFMAGDGKGPVDPGKLDQLAAAVATCGC